MKRLRVRKEDIKVFKVSDIYFTAGMDYSDDSNVKNIPIFFDKFMNAITVKDLGNGCCTPTKTSCDVVKKRKHDFNECRVETSKQTFCDKKKSTPKSRFQTCSQLKSFVKKMSDEQEKAREEEAKERKKMSKTPGTNKHTNSTTNAAVDYSEGHDDHEERHSKSKKGNSDVKVKDSNELSISALWEAVSEINSPQAKTKPNSKCKEKKSKR